MVVMRCRACLLIVILWNSRLLDATRFIALLLIKAALDSNRWGHCRHDHQPGLTTLLRCGAICRLVTWFMILAGGSLQAQTLSTNKPPGGNFNLTNFYLGLPVDSSGTTNGNSASVTAAQLTAGYSNAFYFYTSPTDGAMTFWAFVNGATTSGSDYPRSELREQINPPSNTSNWVPYGVHLLTAQCRVTQVASNPKVIIGQIHCQTGNARPLLKLQFNNGVIEALVKTNSNFDPDYKFFFQNVGLNNLITYQLKMENGLLTTTVNGSNQSINVFATDPDWATNGLYFKAGSYCQDNVGPDTEGARVSFYALGRSHAPSITNQPVSRSVVAGGNTTFSVNAVGNGPLRYQWRFNETNNLANATNSTFSLTNIQSGLAGGYTVKVTDNLGSITSVVATLTVILPPAIVTQPTNQLVVLGSNAVFATAATGSVPLVFRWYYNTNTPLAGATNSSLVISNASAANTGMYSVIVTNSAGTATSSHAALVVNNPPVPGNVSGVTGQAVPLAIPTANVLAAATDPDGDSLSVVNVSPTSSQGGTVWLTNSSVWYSPAPGFTGTDQWNYLLTDSRGASTAGIASVSVIPANAVTLLPVGQGTSSDGFYSATFLGVPGLVYSLDRATDLAGPWELGFTNLAAGTNGLFGISGPILPAPAQQFYRVRYP